MSHHDDPRQRESTAVIVFGCGIRTLGGLINYDLYARLDEIESPLIPVATTIVLSGMTVLVGMGCLSIGIRRQL